MILDERSVCASAPPHLFEQLELLLERDAQICVLISLCSVIFDALEEAINHLILGNGTMASVGKDSIPCSQRI